MSETAADRVRALPGRKVMPSSMNGHNEEPAAAPLRTWVDVARDWQPLSDLQVRKIAVRWAVETLIQAGKVGALVAAGGTGKTTILLTLAICIATGRAFMGLAVRQGTFVLLSNDDPQDDIEGALALVARAMKLTPDEYDLVQRKVRVISLQGLGGQKAFTYAAQGSVVAAGLEHMVLEAVGGIDDLVGISLDTLRQFSGGSSNDEQVIKLTVAGATDIAVKTGAFVILPHHTGKQNYRDGIADQYAGSGSAAIADNCRFVFVLQTASWADIEAKVKRTGQEEGDPLVLTSTRGSLLVKAPPPLYLHRSEFLIERIAGDVLTRGQVADARDRKVLEAIRSGAQSKRAIRSAVGGNARALDSLVDDLAFRGLIEPGGGSAGGSEKWVVSAAGARVLEASDAVV